MQIEPQTPQEAWMQLSKMRQLFKRMRDERMNHPTVSAETKEHVASYYGDMMEAIDIGMAAIHVHHHLKIEPNLLTQAHGG